MKPLELEHRQDAQGREVVAVRGEIDVATSPALREELYAIIDGGPEHWSSTSRASDSSTPPGLGVLVAALKHMRERDGELVLAGLAQPALRVFEITDLTALFTIEPAAS